MQIELTPEQDDLIRLAIEQGRFHDPIEAVHKALDNWVERERVRLELLASIEEGERSIEEGRGIVLDSEEDIRNFLSGIEAKGRDRLAALHKEDRCA